MPWYGWTVLAVVYGLCLPVLVLLLRREAALTRAWRKESRKCPTCEGRGWVWKETDEVPKV